MTGHLLYTDQDVELVAASLPIDHEDGTTVVEILPWKEGQRSRMIWGDPQRVARAVLATLSSAGRLLPPGSENACPKCAEDARRTAAWQAEKAAMSDDELHARRIHPDYEYLTVTVGRKSGEDDSPPDDSWEPNDFIDMGSAPDGTPYPRRNWERFDYTEDTYYRRRRSVPDTEPEG